MTIYIWHNAQSLHMGVMHAECSTLVDKERS